MSLTRWMVLLLALGGCATAEGVGGDGDGDGDTGDGDTGDGDTGDGDGDVTPDAAAGTGLDPDLDVADPGGQVCSTPGSMGECPNIEVCRFFDSASGRCESCTTCGNLGDACAASVECDILFMCFQGRCTNFCTLGSTECGAPDDCIDIGHPDRGVCVPI